MKDLKTHYTEAKLVQLLEQNGIGRPSTFSSLVDKIQERNYVKKDNVKGKTESVGLGRAAGNKRMSVVEGVREHGVKFGGEGEAVMRTVTV